MGELLVGDRDSMVLDVPAGWLRPQLPRRVRCDDVVRPSQTGQLVEEVPDQEVVVKQAWKPHPVADLLTRAVVQQDQVAAERCYTNRALHAVAAEDRSFEELA